MKRDASRAAVRCCKRLATLCLIVAALQTQARAEELPDQGWSRLTVGVLPVRDYTRDAAGLFRTSNPDVTARWVGSLERLLRRLDEVKLVPSAELLGRLASRPDYKERDRLGATYQKLGRESFEAVQQARALELLGRASEAYLAVHADTVKPARAADVYFYRGLALLEAGKTDAAHVALRTMFLLDPKRSFKPGYYGKNVEAALRRALTDIASQPDPARLLYDIERLVGLAQRARVAVLVLASVVGSARSPVLQLTLFDVRSRGILLSERVPVGATAVEPNDRLDRVLTGWHTCHVEARVKSSFVIPRRRLGVFVEVGYAHTLMLKHQTRAMFHSPGAYISVTWEPSENFVVFGRTIQMVSLPDANTDLLESFMTSRLAIGVGLTGGSRNIRGFLEAGVEAGFAFNDIQLSRDVDCKHFGAQHPRCTSVSTFQAPGVWFGFAVGAGLRWRLIQSWHMRASIDASLYVADTELVKQLNFPLSISLGIGNQF